MLPRTQENDRDTPETHDARAPAASRAAKLSRVGMLLTTLLLAVALVFSALDGWRAAIFRRNMVDRGQGERFFHAYASRFGPSTGLPGASDLAGFVRDHEFEGLRAAVLLDPEGLTLAVGGQPLVTTWSADLAEGPQLRRVQSRLRISHPLHPRPGGQEPPPPPPRGPRSPEHFRFEPIPPGAGEPSRYFSPPRPRTPRRVLGRIVLEFVPTASASLVSQAARNLQLGLGVAGLLAVVSLLLWRQTLKADRLRARYDRQERLAVLGTMSAVLAHEIRNPLAALKGHAQLLAERLSTAGRDQEQAAQVVTAAERLESLVTDLLDFVREGPLFKEPLDPAELLHEVVTEQSSEVTLDLDRAPASWSLDRARVRRALENLVANALQVAPAGTVSAAVYEDQGALVFSISDGGPGVAADQRERIFEPFVTTRARGVGLGLAVVRRVAVLHGGSATVRPRRGGGSEFLLVVR